MAQSAIYRLDTASERVVRNVLRELLVHDTQNVRRATAILDTIEKSKGQTSGSTIHKRKADSDAHICVKYKRTYLDCDTDKTSCRFHDGKLEVMEDAWPDWNENCFGEIDTPENRREYPEGFEWTCCQEPGNFRGCKVGRHRAVDFERGGKTLWQDYPSSEGEGDEKDLVKKEDDDDDGAEEDEYDDDNEY